MEEAVDVKDLIFGKLDLKEDNEVTQESEPLTGIWDCYRANIAIAKNGKREEDTSLVKAFKTTGKCHSYMKL